MYEQDLVGCVDIPLELCVPLAIGYAAAQAVRPGAPETGLLKAGIVHRGDVSGQLSVYVIESDDLDDETFRMHYARDGGEDVGDHREIVSNSGRRATSAAVVRQARTVGDVRDFVGCVRFLSTAILPSVIKHVYAWVGWRRKDEAGLTANMLQTWIRL